MLYRLIDRDINEKVREKERERERERERILFHHPFYYSRDNLYLFA